ncbi:MAG: glycosylase [Prevotellaceae bacterium]|jgi:predicted GH43/DUF377 family glycosyl hydrolase|nr:glycosylase [Prevotellaceae bacterium]
MVKQLFILLCAALLALGSCADGRPAVVPEDVMQSIYEEVKTPYKYGLVMVPEGPDKKLDCPTVFRCRGRWYMTYIAYDGRGYETWLAQSDSLLDWTTLGRIMPFTPYGWDANQKAGYLALQDYTWGGSYAVQQHAGKHWMSYIGGSDKGYETGQLAVGVAYTSDSLTAPHEWKRLPAPVLSPVDADVRWWENRKHYKSTVIWDKEKLTGYPFVMFYNANGDTTGSSRLRWFERIGMAVSDNMTTWKRLGREPVLAHSHGITGDAVIQKIGDVFVMFYFGAFWEGHEREAFNSFACSYDLLHWTDWTGAFLITPSEKYDNLYAHKSFVLKHNGVVYHFYNAVDEQQNRGIAVATSKDLGKSPLRFNSASPKP